MNWAAFGVAAVLLGVERITYAVAWYRPRAFQRWCARPALAWAGGPVAVLRRLFLVFKAIQVGVFVWWCLVHGGTLVPSLAGPWATLAGALLILAGMALNTAVFHRLGATGVFYGSRFGREVPWVREFPFSWFRHPQYLGATMLVWGFFVVMRYPAPDWYAVPAIETVYYVLGSWQER